MPMKKLHVAGAAPPAMLAAVYLPAPAAVSGLAEVGFRAGLATLVLSTSTINDWDHSRFRGRWPPGALLARPTARWMYRVRTSRDLDRWADWEAFCARTGREYDPDDVHRGPTHSFEWGGMLALALGWLASEFPPLAPVWWWVTVAVFLGTASHVVLDAMTPAGVPASPIYNWLRYGEVWRRHAFAFKWHPIGRPGDRDTPIVVRVPGVVLAPVRLWPLPVWREVPWVGLVDRELQYPTPTVIPVDRSHDGCRAGLFYTDSVAEKLFMVPVMVAVTGVLGLVLTGLFGPVMFALTGWPIFGGL